MTEIENEDLIRRHLDEVLGECDGWALRSDFNGIAPALTAWECEYLVHSDTLEGMRKNAENVRTPAMGDEGSIHDDDENFKLKHMNAGEPSFIP